LRALRAREKLSLRDLAKRVNLSPIFISQMERGEERPSAISVAALESALHADPYELAQHLTSESVRRAQLVAIHDALVKAEGNLRKAAKALGVGTRDLLKLMERHGLSVLGYNALAQEMHRAHFDTVAKALACGVQDTTVAAYLNSAIGGEPHVRLSPEVSELGAAENATMIRRHWAAWRSAEEEQGSFLPVLLMACGLGHLARTRFTEARKIEDDDPLASNRGQSNDPPRPR